MKAKKRRGRGRRRREEEKKRGSSQKGMDLTLDMSSIMNHMDFVWDSRKVDEFQI